MVMRTLRYPPHTHGRRVATRPSLASPSRPPPRLWLFDHDIPPLAPCQPRRHAATAKRSTPKTAIFFPGQGVQRVGMLTPWLTAFPATARSTVEEIDDILGYKLSAVIQSGPCRLLTETPHAQPAIMATSILILRVLEREFGFSVPARADYALGHSLGEFAALVAAGNLAFADALQLVRRRADAMAAATRAAAERAPGGGAEYGMVAVVAEPEHLPALLDAARALLGRDGGAAQATVANVNSKSQIVLSGDLARIRALIAHVSRFLGHDPRAVRLKSDSPFHSPIMRPAVAVVRSTLAGRSRAPGREGADMVSFPGQIPCVSNVTARPFASKAELEDLLARQCLETVRWWDSIRYLDQECRVRRWVGIGPGKVGRNLVGKEVGMRGKDPVKGGGVWAITDPAEIEEALRGLEETECIEDEE